MNNIWENIDTCWYKLDKLKNNNPFIIFDYDDTLCKKFTSELLENVKNSILELNKEYNICIFTNQMGISKKKTSHDEVRKLFNEFQKKINNIPLQIFYSTSDDLYRKPMTGMFKLMTSIFKKSKIEYYCGDAGGRKKDFSVSDLYFANNCELIFKVPEEVFLQSEPANNLVSKNLKSLDLYKDDIWENGILQNPREIIKIKKIKEINKNIFNQIVSKTLKNLIIMIGPQGSGKSTLSIYLSELYEYGLINGDSCKTKNEMKKKFKEFQLNSIYNGIIIDNTNPLKKTRDEWKTLLIEKKKWNILIIHIDINKFSEHQKVKSLSI